MSDVFLRWIGHALRPLPSSAMPDRRAALAILDKLPTHLAFSPRLVKTLAACLLDTLDTDPLSPVSASLFRLILHHPSLHRNVHIGPIDIVAFLAEYLQALAHNNHEVELEDDERRFCAGLLCSIRRSPLRDAILHHPRVLPLLCDPAQHSEDAWCQAFLRCPSPQLFEALRPAIEAHLREGNPEVAWTIVSTAPKDQQKRHRPWLLGCLPLLLPRIHHEQHAHLLTLCQFVAAYDPDMQALTPTRWDTLLAHLAAKHYPPTLSRAVLTAALRQRWPASDLDRLLEVLLRTDWALVDADWMDGLSVRVDLAFCEAAATYLLRYFLRGGGDAPAAVTGTRRRTVHLRFLRLVMAQLAAPLPGVHDMFQESAVLRPQWTARVLMHVGPVHAHHLRKVLQFLLLHVDPQVVSFPFEAAAAWIDMGVQARLRLPLQDMGETMTALVEEQWGDDEVVARVLGHHAPQRTFAILRRMLQRHSLVSQQLAVEYLQRLQGMAPYRDQGWPDALEDTLYRTFCAGWYARAQPVHVKATTPRRGGAANADGGDGHLMRGRVLRDHANGTYTVRLDLDQRTEVRAVHFLDMIPMDEPSFEGTGKVLFLTLWTDAARRGIKLPLTHHKLWMHLLAHHNLFLDEALEEGLRTLLCALGDARCPRFRVHLHRFLQATVPLHVPGVLFRVLGHVRRAVGEPAEIDCLLRTFQSTPPALVSLVQRHQSLDPPMWLVTAMIENAPGGVSALPKSRISPACLWRRLGEYVRSRPHPVLRDLRHKHNFLHAVLYARRIAYYGSSGAELAIPPIEGPFFEELTAAILDMVEMHHRRQTDAGSLTRMSVKCLLKIYTHNPHLVTSAVARMVLRMHHLTLTAPTLNVIFSGTSYLDHDFGNLVRAKLAMPPPPNVRTVLGVRRAQDAAATAAAKGRPSSPLLTPRRTRETEARDLVANMSTDTLRELLEYMDLPMVAGGLE